MRDEGERPRFSALLAQHRLTHCKDECLKALADIRCFRCYVAAATINRSQELPIDSASVERPLLLLHGRRI